MEGWIAVGDNGKDWMADSSKDCLLESVAESKDAVTDIVWKEPIPCTITIPDGGKRWLRSY